MRVTPFLLALAGILIAGCANHSIECSMGTSHKDCAPGTAGHDVAKQEQEVQKSVAAIDDAKCRAYADPGSAAYAQCRTDLRKQRPE